MDLKFYPLRDYEEERRFVLPGSHEIYFYISEGLPDRIPCVLNEPGEQ